MGVSKPHASDTLARLASGIEAGVIGGLAVLGVLISESLLRGHVWWEILNLLGTTVYGPRSFRAGPGLVTLAGAALHFTIAGTIGALFGLVFGTIRERRRLLPLGFVTAMIWYLLADAIFWPRVNPLVPLYENTLYAFQPVSILSHAIFGACLGWMGPTERAQVVEQPLSIVVESREPEPVQSQVQAAQDISTESELS